MNNLIINCEEPTIFIGCNSVSNCIDWGINNNLIVFGAYKFVVIYNCKLYKILCTLKGHTGRVNTVKWIKSSLKDERIISGSSDKQIIIWKKCSNQSNKWSIESILNEHKDSIIEISCISYNNQNNNDLSQLLMVSCDSNCKLLIWKAFLSKEKNESLLTWKLFQTISFDPKMIMSIDISFIHISSNIAIPIIAVGGVDTMIYLYIELNGTFFRLLSLSGHEDWIRSLSFVTLDPGEDNKNSILLASSSQDGKIRLWKIIEANDTNESTTSSSSYLFNSINQNITSTSLSSKFHVFKVENKKYNILLESIMAAHNGWVLQIKWHPKIFSEKDRKSIQPLCLVSASMDRTMIIWKFINGMWIEYIHVGSIGTGVASGFLGCAFDPLGKYILAYDRNGAFHMWEKKIENQQEIWIPSITLSGHFGEVMDITWGTDFNYILSVSEDQTSRLFARWIRKDEETSQIISSWHEISRPQMHGHNLNCLTLINNSKHRYASGAQEKVIRVFDAPQIFLSTFQNISNIDPEEKNSAVRPIGANVPPLGLSNKPLYEGKSLDNLNIPELSIAVNDIDGPPPPPPIIHLIPPLEDHLLQSTLWPEIHKLYGHPNEIICLCSNYKGNFIASSCKGTKLSESAIVIWDTNSWTEVTSLISHKLTVVQMEFSHDDQFLLSVGRDRLISIFQIDEKQTENNKIFQLIFKSTVHERIIWSCSWSLDDNFFATGARDKMVKIWKKNNSHEKLNWDCEITLQQSSAVTALAWAPIVKITKFHYILAIGLEDGNISLYTLKYEKNWEQIFAINTDFCHCETVRRLKWKNLKNENENEHENNIKETLELASCSTDHSIRIFKINFDFE